MFKMDVTDEVDFVVKEIPVHLCKKLHGNLYLFQYPGRAADAKNSTKNIVSSRVKPNNGLIELDCSLNVENKFYDKYVGEDMAIDGTAKTRKEEQRNCNSKLLDKITLQSQHCVSKKDLTSYSVACLYDGKFCISSLRDSVSFLPIFDHVEKNNVKVKSRNISTDISSSEEDNETDENSSAVQVTVKFSQRTTDKFKISQELNHQQYITKIKEEPWCETIYFNNTSSTALTIFEDLTNTVSRRVTPMLSLSENQYLDVLISSDTTDVIEKEINSSS